MSKQHMTNVEFVTNVMEFSNFGPMAQLFVMEAISKYAEQVANAPEEAFESMKGGLINPDAWQGVAREIHNKVQAHYGK